MASGREESPPAKLGKWTDKPFALFIIVDLPVKTVNDILSSAYGGCAVHNFWVVTKDYSDAPKKRPRYVNSGNTSVDSTWTSPWIGSKPEELAAWLRSKPEEVDLDANHFAILDKISQETGDMLLCKIGDRKFRGNALSFLRQQPPHASNLLGGLESGEWEENYEGVKGARYTVEIDYGEYGGKEVRGRFPDYTKPA